MQSNTRAITATYQGQQRGVVLVKGGSVAGGALVQLHHVQARDDGQDVDHHRKLPARRPDRHPQLRHQPASMIRLLWVKRSCLTECIR